MFNTMNRKCINTIRVLSAEMINKAGSGHTGVALGATTMLYTLFRDHYNFYGSKDNLNRDRLVLSAGHASALYYALMHMFGFDVTIDDLKAFRQYKSKTPGHPEIGITDGVEVSTGPLGQGVANAVGLAIAQKSLAERFNAQNFEISNNYTYCFVGDGCLMEGVALESISLAGQLQLNKLILLYDANQTTLDSSLNNSNQEDVRRKFKAQGWNVEYVPFGDNCFFISLAIARAKRSKKPTLIMVKTVIGLGTKYAGSHMAHGKVLSDSELLQLKIDLGISGEFFVPREYKQYCYKSFKRAKAKFNAWEKEVLLYKNTHPELSDQYQAYFDKPKFNYQKIEKHASEEMSMRDANHIVLNHISTLRPCMIGGSADLESSTKVGLDNQGYFGVENCRGKNIRFGVREHAMAGICNGITLYNNAPSFCSTFLTFANYLMPSLRMTCLMEIPVQYHFTHDSFYCGQDGPTHQPIEQLSQLRAMPNLFVFRPADFNELVASHKFVYENGVPSAFALAKQTLKPLENSSVDKALNGGYIVSEENSSKVIIYATGSEVSLALEIQEALKKFDINTTVASFPCLELFDQQSAKYQASVLKPNVEHKVALEASNDSIWYKYVGKDGLVLNVNEFGLSAPSEASAEYFGFDVKTLIKKIKAKIQK